MAVSLAEYMRSVQVSDPMLAGIVKVYTENAPILGQGVSLGLPLPTLKFETAVGGVASFVRQKTLPTTGFRSLNNEFEAAEGETEKVTVDLKIGGGRVNIDRALRARGGDAGLVTQMEMQIASFARKWNKTFYKGNATLAPAEFDGLQNILTGNQVADNAGGGLNLYKLDQLLLAVRGTDRVIVMGTGLAARLFQAAKSNTNVNYTPDIYGKSPASYNGVPILLAGEDIDESEILSFNEENNTTSLYVLALGDTGVVGVETKPLSYYYPNGEQAVDSGYIVEWDSAFIIKSKRSAYRLSNIANVVVGGDAPTPSSESSVSSESSDSSVSSVSSESSDSSEA